MIISTDKEKCRQCYACVRNCPVKAVKIENGQAEVIESRCIECGNCLRVCSQGAKKIKDSSAEVKSLLQGPEPVALILAPSFVANFHNYQKIAAALKKIGFHDVWSASLGAQLLASEYERLLQQDGMVIASPCPAVVNLIEKHFPSLLPSLAPLVSPMVATALYIKSIHPARKIVFAGPCIAKKGEAERFRGLLECALTFTELNKLLEEAKIDIDRCEQANFSGPLPFNGQLIPLSGGLTKMLDLSVDLLEMNYLVVDGQAECLQTLKSLAHEEIKVKFLDILMCQGCIDGPAQIGANSTYNRKKTVIDYFEGIPLYHRFQGKTELGRIQGLDLGRVYADRKLELPVPNEVELEKILASIGKFKVNDELNCGACGYGSCREKALAVYQGIAEVEMCLPYLLDKKEKLLGQLDQELEIIKELHSELDSIVDSSYDGICVVDAKGIILKTNKAFTQLYDLPDVVGTSAPELEERGLIYPSGTLLVINEQRPVTFIQQIHNGRKLYVTATPIFNEDGALAKILINSRDFEELDKLKRKISCSEAGSVETRKNFGTDNIIAFSNPMARVLEECRRIARVDTTVLITGESGVGKEVVAGYIHGLSKRKNKPWIKVNCGAIPETLMESELFGYEAGSFTGAKKEGKPGFFELSHQGTIFLDEIGELPFNLQVKLLQVLQEKCLVRLGGTKPIKIDTRIIAATNRNLEEMVAKGRFRQDLYYRLNVVPIQVPPLRHRKDDVIPLVNYFLNIFNQRYGLDKKYGREVLRIFSGYDWPGNIRELMNLVERLVVTTDKEVIERDSLPRYLAEKSVNYHLEVHQDLPKLQEAVEELEKEILSKAYKLYGNSYKIAEILGINQSTVVRKLKKHGIT